MRKQKMKLEEYVEQLLELNYEKLESRSNPRYFAHVLFGLVEEILELNEVIWVDNIEVLSKAKYELGDIFAYATLCVASTVVEWFDQQIWYDGAPTEECLKRLTTLTLNYMKDPGNENNFNILEELALDLVSKAKRWFREGKEIDVSLFPKVAFDSWRCYNTSAALQLAPTNLGEVLKLNIEKLKDRHKRGVMFEGEGDFR